MSDTIFQNSEWVLPSILMAGVLWAVFVWKEWQRPVKRSFFLSAGVALITVLSFTLLALRPMIRQERPSVMGIMTTNGFDTKRLDSLRSVYRQAETMAYEANKAVGEKLDSLHTLLLLGEGVQPYDFWQFENRAVSYMPSAIPDGIVALKYARENALGAQMAFGGTFQNGSPNKRLVLQDAAGIGLDSVTLISAQEQQFELSTSLKAKGKFVFELVEKDTLGTIISREPLPFRVFEPEGLKIVLINGFPTFESKYLKNYLAEMGHELVVRSQLTRGRYKFEYFNTKRSPIYRLGEKDLAGFDLMVIDDGSLARLSRPDLASIENSIKEQGLGVFVQGDASWFAKKNNSFRLGFEADGRSSSVLQADTREAIEIYPFRFSEGSGLQQIHKGTTGPITAYRRMQLGRVGTTLAKQTYQLQLQGKPDRYRRFWSEVVNGLSKRSGKTTDWEITTQFPIENEPLHFRLRTTHEKPQVQNQEGQLIPIEQDLDIPTLWTGTTYPAQQGWNVLQLRSEPQESLDYYVIDQQNWQALRTNQLHLANKRHFSEPTHASTTAYIHAPIEPLWFFLLGLLGMGYLWVYPKLFPQ